MNHLEKQILRIIGEDPDSPDVFTDDDTGLAQIRGSINDAIQEICALTGSNKKHYRIPLVQDQMFYRVSLTTGDFGWVTDAWLIGQRRRLAHTDIIKVQHENPRWMIASDTPDRYLQIGSDVIGFYPRPASTTDMVDLTCVVIPKAYENDNDRLHVREAFERATVHFAVSEYWASRGDAREALKHHGLYLDILDLRDKVSSGGDHRPYLRTRNEPSSAAQ